MAPRKTTVTHPDGTVSKRSSERAVYAYAVEVTTNERVVAAGERAFADKAEADAARLLTAFTLDDVVEERRPWGGYGGEAKSTYVNVSLRAHDGGANYWIGAYVIAPDGTVKKPLDVAAAVLYALTNYAKAAAQYRAAADRLDAGPELTYSVVRWSRTKALAEKGAVEFRHLTTRVVPVDQTVAAFREPDHPDRVDNGPGSTLMGVQT